MTTYFVSKYAFPKGKITTFESGDSGGVPPKGYVFHPSTWQAYRVGTDVHLTLAAAIKDAENRRRNMIAGLQAKIDTLEKIKFSLVSRKAE